MLKFKNIIKQYILLLVMLQSAAYLYADDLAGYDKWMDLDSKKLLKIGIEHKKRGAMDSAMVLYTIVSNRAESTDDKEELELCCAAYIEQATLYLDYFFNYSKAYENIMAANELHEKAGTECFHVQNITAAFYNIMAVTCRDNSIYSKAIKYSKKSYNTAYKNKDRKNMNVAVINMLLTSANMKDLSTLNEVWKTYRSDDDESYEYVFNNVFYRYLQSMNKKDYATAVKHAGRILEMSSDASDNKRIIVSYTSLIDAYKANGDYAEALSYIDKEEKLVRKIKMREHVVELFKDKEDIYRIMGNEKMADSCLHMYMVKKDSLLNMQQMNTINRLLYDKTSRDMKNEIKEMGIKNDLYNKIIVIVTFFLIILVIMIVALYIKIKQLNKSNITIYENNEEIIKHEEKERQTLKEEVCKLENRVVEEEVCCDEDDGEDEVKIEDENKYKTYTLSEEDKKKLLDKILTVMENVEEICSESFSATRLAELTDSKYNYVSLVINDYYGCNFNNFLNKFRVKEACRRLSDDENYGNYTIDAISASIGFKSRTTLTTSFKKIVGLTPSQYRNIAKEKTSAKNQAY